MARTLPLLRTARFSNHVPGGNSWIISIGSGKGLGIEGLFAGWPTVEAIISSREHEDRARLEKSFILSVDGKSIRQTFSCEIGYRTNAGQEADVQHEQEVTLRDSYPLYKPSLESAASKIPSKRRPPKKASLS